MVESGGGGLHSSIDYMHPTTFLLKISVFTPVRCGGAGGFFKKSGKIGGVVEPRLVGNLLDGQVGGFQQFFGPLQTELLDI